jgi:hypothetical protein
VKIASVMPKVGLYAFLSIICLLINISLFATALIDSDVDIETFIVSDEYDVYDDEVDDYANTTATDFVIATGGSFIPFYSILTISTYIGTIPDIVTVLTAIVFTIISAFQVFLLATIILNMLPKILGSGFDV